MFGQYNISIISSKSSVYTQKDSNIPEHDTGLINCLSNMGDSLSTPE